MGRPLKKKFQIMMDLTGTELAGVPFEARPDYF